MKFIHNAIKYFSASNYRTLSLLMVVLISALFLNSQIDSSSTLQKISSETPSYGSISDCESQCTGGCVLDSKNTGQYICQGEGIGGDSNGNPGNGGISCSTCSSVNMRYICNRNGSVSCSTTNTGSCQDCGATSPINPNPPDSNNGRDNTDPGNGDSNGGGNANITPPPSSGIPTPSVNQAQPSPSQGNNPNPTAAETPMAGEAVLNLSIKIPGVGSSEAGENSAPKHRERDFVVQLFDKDDKMVKQTNARLNFDGNLFKGTAKISDVAKGNYVVKVKSNNSLFKAAPGVVNIQEGEAVQIPQLTLVSGNVNDSAESKNNLNALDYNSVISYFGKSVNDVAGELADLNDDGVVNEKDMNILLRGFVIRKGD